MRGMTINWRADPNTPDTAWTNFLSVSSLFVKPLQQFCYKSCLSLRVRIAPSVTSELAQRF